MIGIKGVGMTALTELLLSQGAKITGSDIEEEFHTDVVLKRLGIIVKPFSPENIKKDLDFVIYSSAYFENHPERQKAKELKLKELSYAQVLAFVFNQKQGIMVTGTHGKTTTTALLGHVLDYAGFDPTVIVGGVISQWNSNVKIGKSDWMIVEGDEYQKKFLLFEPKHLLITNIDYDHPDTFKDKKEYRAAFEELKQKVSGKLLFFEEFKASSRAEKIIEDADLKILGRHNKNNALLVAEFALQLGVNSSKIKNALEDFKGIKRRCEFYCHNPIIIDDYAHHPAEIIATLSALKEEFPEYKIHAVFQSHTYTRTKKLFDDFVSSFKDADKIYLLPIYASARENIKGKGGLDKKLFNALSLHANVNFYNSKEEASKALLEIVKDGKNLIITLGAGDVWQIAKNLTNLCKSQ